MSKEAIVNKVRPLIKWTGGKYDEFSEFAHLIPEFTNYYEPFFGGGGVFFALQPKGKSYLNDKSIDLINFYKNLQNENLKVQLNKYADAWDSATRLKKEIAEKLFPAFLDFVEHNIEKPALLKFITECVEQVDEQLYSPLFDEDFIIDTDAFKKRLVHSLQDKFNRIKNIQNKESKTFLHDELKVHVETGVKSGLYLYLRSLSNRVAMGTLVMSEEKAVANWYFVREFCYASMFRFNRKGEFNIPYGGIAYNRKNFRSKVDAIFSDTVKDVLTNAHFYNLDFAEFLDKTKPTAEDFVFLDPPYDSEFSEYDQNAFTKDDQLRLRDAILKCKGKCMVVIKETDFIRNLYSGKPFRIVDFDKIYTYNVRGRNNRGTKHLIILNY